ncbi:DoxX family membrane protein [Silvanigrella sp.]
MFHSSSINEFLDAGLYIQSREIVFGIAVLIGLLTRFSAISQISTMVVAL